MSKDIGKRGERCGRWSWMEEERGRRRKRERPKRKKVAEERIRVRSCCYLLWSRVAQKGNCGRGTIGGSFNQRDIERHKSKALFHPLPAHKNTVSGCLYARCRHSRRRPCPFRKSPLGPPPRSVCSDSSGTCPRAKGNQMTMIPTRSN